MGNRRQGACRGIGAERHRRWETGRHSSRKSVTTVASAMLASKISPSMNLGTKSSPRTELLIRTATL